MQKIKTISLDINEANKELKTEYEQKYWEFLIQQLDCKEVTFSGKKNTILYPSYIPIKDLIKEILGQIEQEYIAVSKCGVCESYFNINKEEGIFGDPQNMERFICLPCSKKLSAREFYENHLKL